MRKPDKRKEDIILSAMRRHREGTYVSEIARETGMSKSTVSFLLAGRLKKKVKMVKSGSGGLFKIFKLKRG